MSHEYYHFCQGLLLFEQCHFFPQKVFQTEKVMNYFNDFIYDHSVFRNDFLPTNTKKYIFFCNLYFPGPF